jgi:hypothetical protein
LCRLGPDLGRLAGLTEPIGRKTEAADLQMIYARFARRSRFLGGSREKKAETIIFYKMEVTKIQIQLTTTLPEERENDETARQAT